MKIGFIIILHCMFFLNVKGERPWKIHQVLYGFTNYKGSGYINDTVYISMKYGHLFYHMPNLIKVTSAKKTNINLLFEHGKVRKINDSIFEVYPLYLGESGICVLGNNKWINNFQFTIVTLPNPEFYIKGIPYAKDDTVKCIFMGDLLRYNEIEALYEDYIFDIQAASIYYQKRDSFGYMRESSTVNSLSSIKFQKERFQDAYITMYWCRIIGPDSIIRAYKPEKKIATVYLDSTEMLMDKYTHVYGKKMTTSDIRVGIKGNPTKEDLQTIKEIIREFNQHLKTIKVKLVDFDATVSFNFDTIEDNVSRFLSTSRNYILFKSPPYRVAYPIKIKKTTQKERDSILWLSVANVLSLRSNNHLNRQYLLLNMSGVPGLSREGKIILKNLHTLESLTKLKENKEADNQHILTNSIPVLTKIIFVIILFFILYEVNNYYGFTARVKKVVFRYILWSIISVQPIFILMIISAAKQIQANLPGSIFKVLFFEVGLCILAILIGQFFLLSDWLIRKLKYKWLRLLLNPILTVGLIVAIGQIVHLVYYHEFFKFADLKPEAILTGLAIITIRFYLQYENAKITSLMQEKEYELTKQKELKTRADLNALQARINPHFLYNALNSIAALSRIDSRGTENMALSLSKLFRYNLNREEEWIISLGKEIEMVKLYLDIEKQRFSDRLNFSIVADENLFEVPIPRFIIQPLVENAIKHGISKIAGQGIIQLKIYKKEKFLVIEVHDNGPAFPEGLLTGYGLQNMYDKLWLIHKKPFEVKFNNEPEKFVQIKL